MTAAVSKPGLVRLGLGGITLETLLTHPEAFGLTTASPLQRAVCRIADGLPLGELATVPEVVAAIGDVAALPSTPPSEVLLLSGIRTGKSLLAAALAVRATQTCNLSGLSAGDNVRVSVLSLTTDLGRVVFGHIVGNVMAKPRLRALVVGEPTSDAITLRHPTGREVEIKVVAGARAGASLVARWSAGCVVDEAARMQGQEDGVVNFDDARRAMLGRLLPGAQLVAISSPWAPRGPIYEMVQEHAGRPTANLVVIRAPAHHMNPSVWTPERIDKLKTQDEQAYRTDILGEFCDPESSLFASTELEAVTRAAPMVLEREERHHYVAAIDPATRGNGWTLAIATARREGTRKKRIAVLVKQWQGSKLAPLKPDVVLKEIAEICAGYGIRHAWTDQWSSDALRALAAPHGLYLQEETMTAARKVEIYETLRTWIAEGDVELPPDPQLRADLLSIRKRVTMTGIAIDLPRTSDGRHADYAPALATAFEKCTRAADGPPLTDAERDQAFEDRLRKERFDKVLLQQRQEGQPWWRRQRTGRA